MTRAFGDDVFERELRAVLDDRAEEIAARARTTAEMTATLAPRLRTPSRAARWPVALRLAALAAILIVILLVTLVLGPGRSRPPVSLRLAVDLPLAGEPGAAVVVDAIRLMLEHAPMPPGITIEVPPDAVFDDSLDGSPDADRGAANMRLIAADPRYVAMIGPYNSFVAEAEIPIANEAGVLQCSPSNTDPRLTIGPEAALLRSHPDRASYVRVAATDDSAVRAAARLLIEVLHAPNVFVAKVEPWAGGRADAFVAALRAAGGSLAGTAIIADGEVDPGLVTRQFRASAADAVFYDGSSGDGGLLLASVSAASPDVPFVGLDTILDGPRSAGGSFLQAAGARVENAYAVFPTGLDPGRAQRVEADYRVEFGPQPGGFALAGYACAEVLVTALGRFDGSHLDDLAEWREALRATVTNGGARYETVLGSVAFDALGDVNPQAVSIYRADATAGDWVFRQTLEIPPG